jgi:peptidoglycan/LPS O-acetylase OafA/YrhL
MMPVPRPDEKKTLLMVQVLRAVAVLMVVGYHVSNLLATRLSVKSYDFFNGSAGVDVFFVISGVVMVISSQSIAQGPRPGRTFFARRVERIVPLYWIATTLKLLILYATAGAAESLWHIFQSYLFLPALQGVRTLPVLTVGWTLNYEMLFYVLFAVALALRMSPLRVLLPTLGLIGMIACFKTPGSTGLVVYEDRIVFEFLFGVGLGQAVRAGKVPGRALSLVLVMVGFAFLFTIEPTFTVTRPVAWGLPALAVVAGAIGFESSIGRLVPGWILEIGDASYAIYLFHGFVLSLLGILIGRPGFGRGFSIALVVILGFVLSLLVGVGVYRAVERPLGSYFRQRRGRAVPANV